MNNLYVDTNIFIYLADSSSSFHQSCLKFIKHCKKEKISLATSTETIQEIVHFAKNTKQLEKGLKVSQKCLQIVNEVLSVNKLTIETYLKTAAVYKTATSRDLIHLAVCLENKLTKMVTFDKDFDKFRELKAVPPEAIFEP